MKSTALTAILSIVLLSSSFAHAQGGGGNSTGNGGKGFNAYLTDAILKIDELLIRECAKPGRRQETWRDKACAAADPLFDRIMSTKILTDYIVYGKIDDKPRDAINDTLSTGEPYIIYSIRNLRLASSEERRRVLLHEFITLCGFEKSDSYGYSTLILNFLTPAPELTSVLAELPKVEQEEKTFRGLEATIRIGSERHPVLIESTSDYNRFCVARGFGAFTSLFLEDVSAERFGAENGGKPLGAVRLNDEGFVIQVLNPTPDKSRVIFSITCK
jgi:hypothetical protein